MSEQKTHHWGVFLDRIVAALLFAIAGLALSRLLYEGLFPRFLMLGRPLPVFLLTAVLTVIALAVWYWLYDRHIEVEQQQILFTAAVFSPLLLNLFYLFDPAVDLAASRILFAASLWLTAVFVARQRATPQQWPWLGILFIWLALFPLYLLAMPAVAGRADTFEFQVVIPQLGIAHPTGYPLYILLGRLFAALPVGTVAWRINLASAVFATLAATFLYQAGRRLWKEPVAALLAAVLAGLMPTLFSQAVEAEVYALHALFVAGFLWFVSVMLDHASRDECCSAPVFGRFPSIGWQRIVWLLALTIGLGLANHLTTLVLLPAAVLAVWLAYGKCLRQQSWRENGQLLVKAGLAFLLPLLLYAYLPLRWEAIHNEPMGWSRFIDWVVGGRFQGALQLTAWLSDLTRYEIVARLLLAEWGWFNLLLVLWGFLYAARRRWRAALVLLLALAGYLFYALNYYVPDLAVFLIPAHLVIALFLGAGFASVLVLFTAFMERHLPASLVPLITGFVAVLLLLPSLLRIVNNWPDTAYENQAALQAWGEGVLSMPLETGAAILADSEKIAPLYYLQQAEGQRLDLDIMVLPDETAYRAEIDARIAAGETVYLARFVPGLESIYHLRSRGPLIEVSPKPLMELPVSASRSDLRFDSLRLIGYEIEEPAAVNDEATAVTLYWTMSETSVRPQFIYVRWSGADFEGYPDTPGGAHPAANYYPTVAFREGEIVPDYHLLPRPATSAEGLLDLQVAAGLQFASAADLAWQTAARIDVAPAAIIGEGTTYRAQNGRMLLSQASFPAEVRPGTPLPVVLGGYGPRADLLELTLWPIDSTVDLAPQPGTMTLNRLSPEPLVYTTQLDTAVPNGRYQLMSSDPLSASICGWLASQTAGCVLGEVAINGVPLPRDAANFEDKIALLEVDVPADLLQPGGRLPVQLRWQALANMTEDYTVFLQVLNDQDQIVGQVDAWPRQGTYPTSQWQPGEIIVDPYEIQLAGDLPPGGYRLQVGWYLLATLQRLPVFDEQGLAIDDKVTAATLTVE